MRGRRVWSDPEIRKLAAEFIPSADEVWYLQNGRGPECDLFRDVSEQGHYRGRRRPSGTRQGIYAVTPSGTLLDSVNTTDIGRMKELLTRAMARWKGLSREERLSSEALPEEGPRKRPEDRYPAEGLVLRVVSRDLPRERVAEDWRGTAWNQDYAWFRKEEARQFLPEHPEPGEQWDVPDRLVRRLVRCNLVDNVRGQTPSYQESDVEKARLSVTVEKVEGSQVTLRLEGESRTSVGGKWSVAGYEDMDRPSGQKRGVEVRWMGHARFDLATGRFQEFDVVVLGTRWGGTQYNFRSDDLDAAPIGFVVTLAGETPAERVAPAGLGDYGW